MIEIIQPGIFSSVQDLGRRGFRSIGVGQSGAMDAMALRIANILVGNPDDAAGIETTLGGLELCFDADCRFAVTGADAEVTLDDQVLSVWSLATARAGQVLRIGWPDAGMRNYIAFAGGVDVPVLMGSRATDLKGGFGGHEGRALRQGDRLSLLAHASQDDSALPFGIAGRKTEPESDSPVTTVRMIPAAEWGQYSPETQQSFLSANWLLDPASNRVGFRLRGPMLTSQTPRELLSHGILPGTVQLPPSGQPAVQMMDANTCGGYPKLGVVIAADLGRLAQTRLGDAVRFVLVSQEDALQALRARENLISAIRVVCHHRG